MSSTVLPGWLKTDWGILDTVMPQDANAWGQGVNNAATHAANSVLHASYAVTSGNGAAYAVANVVPIGGYADGMQITIVPGAANEASPTLNIDGQGATPLVNKKSQPIGVRKLLQGIPYTFVYSGGSFFLMGEGGGDFSIAALAITTSSTWTAPDGVASIFLWMIGGGGGGGGTLAFPANLQAGGDGASGWIVSQPVSVVPGQGYPIAIGAGGTGGTNSPSSTAHLTKRPGRRRDHCFWPNGSRRSRWSERDVGRRVGRRQRVSRTRPPRCAGTKRKHPPLRDSRGRRHRIPRGQGRQLHQHTTRAYCGRNGWQWPGSDLLRDGGISGR